MKCRHCGTQLRHVFADLGFSPPSNAYLKAEQLQEPEEYYPLKIFACDECFLVQTQDFNKADKFFDAEYAYFSSVSTSWLDHAKRYCDQMRERLSLNDESFVIEVASNDGYLLKNFVAMGIPCLGIEPTDSTADASEKVGVPVLREFFGEELAKRLAAEGKQADLIAGNNVYAHVPDINDFTNGLKAALKSNGTVTLEFPHLLQLVTLNQFDTIYHEHFSYLSLTTVQKIFEKAGLRVFDVEKLPTHGGSLRVFGCHAEDARKTAPSVKGVIDEEKAGGLHDIATYTAFQSKADKVKNDFLKFLIDAKESGQSVAGYGAAAKGNTLMNYAGVKPDLVSYVCDAAPSKQNKFLPGTHIPVYHPDELAARKPDWVVIFPWNIADEVVSQQSRIREWGGKFVTAVPTLKTW